MSTAKAIVGQYKQNKQLSTTNTKNLRATSMQNLAPQTNGTSPRRSSSRCNLDNIHNGMNAKYASIQSKVLLNNIKPQQTTTTSSQNKLNATQIGTNIGSLRAPTQTRTFAQRKSKSPAPASSDRASLLQKIKHLTEELSNSNEQRAKLEQEIGQEKARCLQQIDELKAELALKTNENERHAEEYHQKLLDAYELADENRRAADNVLSESRSREEALRKRADELEIQLAEVREFVALREEMASKMGELREQLRDERERYEQQLRGLRQMFESEKVR